MVAVMVPAPKDVAELHRDYYQYVCHLLVSEGIPPQEIEDAASDIFTRLIQLDVIGQFDPEHEIVHGGQVIAPNFRTFLSRKISLYARGQRDKVRRRTSREVLAGGSDEGATSWIEALVGEVWDDYSNVSNQEFVSRMRRYLASLPPRAERDRCDLVALFDELVRQGWQEGKLDFSIIQDLFGISPTSAYAWVNRLRDKLREAPANFEIPPARTWDVAGVELTEADLREAVAILKSKAGGIMVKQPLASHPLSKAPEGWYHSFSKEERKLYPELEIDPATHKKPAGHVRKAVVHRLERMLDTGGPGGPVNSSGSIPVASTPEPDMPEDLFEAALWRLGADAAAVDQIKALAAQVYA